MNSKPRLLGDLDERRHAPMSVRQEVRRNLTEKIRAGDKLFAGIVGFDETVIPQLVNALLARHDIIFLGLRGQAKTRLCRLLAELLDPEVPMIAGSPLREHPLQPLTEASRARVREAGRDLPIEWLPREARYAEKLATPDVTVADLIGDIDPLKAAHRKLDLSSEEVIHFGIVPRMNRGIFAINELPDLAPRIQVGLLNLLEERDVQIRGFPVRIPLDVLMVFTANPEDYTNRGAIITPLKDRIASQILTHYPRSLADAKAITGGEAWTDRDGDLPPVEVPDFMDDIIEEIAFRGRESEYVDQTSGVSARLPIAAREVLVSQVERRLLRQPRSEPVARLIDFAQLVPAITGKIELVYEGEQEGALKVARHLIGAACRTVFDRRFPDVIREGSEERRKAPPREGRGREGREGRSREESGGERPAAEGRRGPGRAGEGHGGEGRIRTDRYKPVLDWFAAGNRLELSDEADDKEHLAALSRVPGLAALADEFLPSRSPSCRAAAMELVLEGLHQHSLLAKEDLATGASYSDMLGIMLEGLK